MKTANLIINWFLSDALCHCTERPPSVSPFDQIWRQGDKNHNFQTFQWIGGNLEMHSRLFTNRNFPSLLWIAKPQTNISKYQCWIYGWVGRTYVLNLSFTVENKMENSHKRGCSHFKLKINDCDIPFPKILRFCQWIGKNIFHLGKIEWTH